MLRSKKRKPTPTLDEYRAEKPPDEILMFLGVQLLPNGGMLTGLRGLWEPHEEIHHIWSFGRRPDIRSNLVGVNSAGHWERHHGTKGEQPEYTCLCLLAKWHKSMKIGNYLEFYHDDLRTAAGRMILPYVDGVTFDDDWLETERLKLESLIRSLETE